MPFSRGLTTKSLQGYSKIEVSYMQTFNVTVGDVVMLKSGGPTMTIEEIGGGRARCVWFEGTQRQGKWFGLVVLEPARY